MVLVSESGPREDMKDCHSTIHSLNPGKAKRPQNPFGYQWKLLTTFGLTSDQRVYSSNKEGPTGASSQCKTTSLNSSISNAEHYAITQLRVVFFLGFIFQQTVIHTNLESLTLVS